MASSVVYSVDSGGDIVKVRTKNYDELGHSKHSALEFSNVDIRDIHNIPNRCLLLLSPCHSAALVTSAGVEQP